MFNLRPNQSVDVEAIKFGIMEENEDLQLAAELGKTLLERNKELETSLRQCQNIIDEQSQEIEYLTKQSTALRKTNDNRIRIYEQLEVSIQELERANQRLALDNSTDKKQIKSLCAYRDVLEARCEDLQKALDDARVQQTIQKEKLRRLSTSKDDGQSKEAATSTSVISQTTSMDQIPDEEEENIINQLSLKNQELKSQMSKDQRKIADLEEEISRRIQDMDMLEEELCQREEQVKSLREKMSSLEELRSENLCARCLKEVDLKMSHEHQMLFDSEEVESIGDGQSYINEVHHDGKEFNRTSKVTE
ncbi:hypothetical protein RUM43_005745 [Polyplax serrata]|uniref:Uncharacterized protein n=1 Tax=Polyplax serrata TaxID=468196 RepID=A0AAN8NWK5_POLSC